MALTKIPASFLDKSAHVDFADSEEIRLGTGNDLRIFHAGTENFIRGNATESPLYIDVCQNLHIRHLDTDGGNAETMIKGIGDGAVELYHNNGKKFETSATGASVTGNLAVSGNLTVSGTTTELDTTNLNVTDKNITLNYHASSDTSSNADGAGLTIQDAVNASTNATLNWSAANDRFVMSHGLEVTSGNVGIGTNSPDHTLHVLSSSASMAEFASSNASPFINFARSGARVAYIQLHEPGASGTSQLRFGTGSGHSPTTTMTIDENNRVGIGTSDTYSRKFAVEGTGDLMLLRSTNSGAGGAQLDLMHDSSSAADNDSIGIINFTTDDRQYASIKGVAHSHSSGHGLLQFGVRQNTSTYNHTAMTIDENGNVGIGTQTPGNSHANANMLVVGSGSAGGMALYNGANAGGYYFARDNANNTDAFDGGMSYDGNRNLKFHTNANATRMTINGSGNVGIGNTNPQHPFIVHLTDGEVAMFGSNGMNNTGQYAGIGLGQVIANGTGYQKIKIVAEGRSSGSYVSNLHFLVDTAADPNSAVLSDSKMMISGSNGHVGIGTTSPDAKLYVSGKDDAGASDLLALQFDNSPGDTGMTFRDIFSGIQSRFTIDSSNTNDLRISSGTQIHLYGGTSNGTGDGHLKINSSGHFTSTYGMIVSVATFAEVSNVGFGSYNNGAWVNGKSSTASWLATAGNGVLKWQTGSVFVNGSLSKNSGSFKIPHPLPSKKSTHALVHSFIEGPQADNIYRGVVDLVNGTATINIDTVSGMTEGTYVLLNTNTSCFTSNETDWDAVKGSVSGNILTITCQNSSSTATVSWLVIGERHDQHMKDTDWTDSDGKVIVEPLKEQEVNLGD